MEILTTEVNKFKEDSHVIDAKIPTYDDVQMMTYTEDFWLTPVNDNVIGSTKGEIDLTKFENGKITILPYFEVYEPNGGNYKLGSKYEITLHGISDWTVVQTNWQSVQIVPNVSIEIEIDDVNTNVEEKINNTINSIKNEDNRINDIGFYSYNIDAYHDVAREIIKKSQEKMYMIISLSSKVNNFETDGHYIISKNDVYKNDANGTGEYSGPIWKDPEYIDSTKLGFRPVLTLRYGQSAEAKNISGTKFKIGDYVKYSAKEYDSWRVLSVNKEENTMDIISTGAVKNITFSGKSGYDNAIEELQREAEQYMVGDRALRTRVVDDLDIDNLKKIKESPGSVISYWSSSKKEKTENKTSYYMIGIYDNTMSSTASEEKNSSNYRYITLYKYQRENDDGNLIKEGESNYIYTAGLRPVITIKLDSAEKCDKACIKKCEKTINIYNKSIMNEQKNKNEEYNKIFNGNAESEFTNSPGDNIYYGNNSTNNTNITNNNCKDGNCCNKNNDLLKILIVIGIVSCVFIFILIINSSLILRKINKDSK